MMSVAADRQFSVWPDHGYSVSYSNCQSFCFRFTWYLCDQTRHIGGTLSSAHVPLHIPKVVGWLIILFAIVCAVAFPLYILLYCWPLSLTGILLCGMMEAYYVWQITILSRDMDDVGGWS